MVIRGTRLLAGWLRNLAVAPSITQAHITLGTGLVPLCKRACSRQGCGRIVRAAARVAAQKRLTDAVAQSFDVKFAL